MLAVPLLALLAAAAPAGAEVVVAPSVVRPGDAVLVRARGAGVSAGTLAGRPLRFWARGAEAWALAGLPLEVPTGPARAEVVGADGAVLGAAALEIVEPGFPSRTLRVAPRFVKPPASARARIARDREAFAAAYDRPFVPPLFTASFEWPRRAGSHGHFGDQRVFNGKKESVHYGVDIDGPRGAPVLAANDGEVVLARDCYYSGNTVVLWHGADLFTLYFHLDRLDARVGARVRRGDRIGVIGSTGRSTGPHLHWSARAAGLLVDPESLLGIDFAAGTAPARRAGPPPPAAREEPPQPPAPPETASPAELGTGATTSGAAAPLR